MIARDEHLEKIYGEDGWLSVLRSALLSNTKYCSVVVSEAVFNKGKDDEYIANGFSLYGGLAVSSSLDRSITGEPLGIAELDWDILDYDILNSVSNAGLVAFVDRKGEVKVWKDRTMSVSSTDPGQYLTNMRIIQGLINSIKYKLQKFIGGPFPRPSVVENLVKEAINESEGFQSVSYELIFYRRLGFITVALNVEFFGFVHALSIEVDLKV